MLVSVVQGSVRLMLTNVGRWSLEMLAVSSHSPYSIGNMCYHTRLRQLIDVLSYAKRLYVVPRESLKTLLLDESLERSHLSIPRLPEAYDRAEVYLKVPDCNYNLSNVPRVTTTGFPRVHRQNVVPMHFQCSNDMLCQPTHCF